MADLHQSKEWADFLTSQSWIVEDLDGAKAYIRKLPLYGSVIKIQRPQIVPPIKTIDKTAQKYHALFVKLEPDVSNKQQRLSSEGFELDKAPNLPTKTLVLELSKSKKELWKALSRDTRRDIEEAKNHQISITWYQAGDKNFGQALNDFSQLHSETGHRQGFWTPNFRQLKTKTEVFGKNAILFLAYPKPYPSNLKPLAGALILIHDATAYYHHTATSTAGRMLRATYLMMWRIIQKTKDLELKTLDLGSIYDTRYHRATKSWQKFSIFKKKWRGREVEYPPPLIKYYHPAVKLILGLDSLLFN